MSFHDRPRAIWLLALLALAVAMIVLASDWSSGASGLRGLLPGARPQALAAAEMICLAMLGVASMLALIRVGALATARMRVYAALAGVIPPAAIDEIARKPSLLEGESRQITYLVCRVRDLPAMSQGFRDDPVAFTRLQARIFTPLMDQVLVHRGTIERISGEGFSCFWNAPLDDPEHAIHACEAASGMMEEVARINEIVTQERRIDGHAVPAIEIGIGISTGPAITGGFRSHGRTTYIAVGECAVRASRIQVLSDTYGPAVIVSEDTRKAAERGFAFLEVDYIALAGGGPVKLYALAGNSVVRASPKFRALTTFHDHIFQSLQAQQWSRTREVIAQCRKLSGASQKLYDLQLDRIARYEATPPGADWDGAFRPILK